jgi:hypothetical protein
MPPKRVTQRRTRLEKHFTDVFSDVLAGLNQQEIARKYKVTPAAVSLFKTRNSEVIEQALKEVGYKTREAAIADKQYRIMEAQNDYNTIEEWLGEHGLSERTVRYDKDGNEIGETIRFRKDLVDARRQLRRDVAEELGQLPRPDQNINVKALMLVRQVEGEHLEELS